MSTPSRLALLACLLAPITTQAAAPPSPPPASQLGTTSAYMPVTSAASRIALPLSVNTFPVVQITNEGTADACFAFGDVTVVATLTPTQNACVPAGRTVSPWVPSGAYLSALTAAGSTSLLVQQWTGAPTATGNPFVLPGTVTPYLTAGTYSYAIPTAAIEVRFIMVGGGGSGGGGAMATLGVNVATGGAGAAPGDIKDTGWVSVAGLTSPIAVTVGAAVTGGAGAAVIGSGTPGAIGNSVVVGLPTPITTFGGGGGGAGGVAVGSTGGSGPSNLGPGITASTGQVAGTTTAVLGNAGGAAAAAASVGGALYANPGGSGASLTSGFAGAPANFKNGGGASGGTLLMASSTAGGAGGISYWMQTAPAAGANGGGKGADAIPGSPMWFPGTGAAGGGGNTAGAGGAGGNGTPGCGLAGAGGGAGTTAGGKGGDGGPPCVYAFAH